MSGPITAAELDAWIDALSNGYPADWHWWDAARRANPEQTRAKLLRDLRARWRDLLAVEARSDVSASLLSLGSVANAPGSSMSDVSQAERDIVTIVRRMAREAAEAGKGGT